MGATASAAARLPSTRSATLYFTRSRIRHLLSMRHSRARLWVVAKGDRETAEGGCPTLPHWLRRMPWRPRRISHRPIDDRSLGALRFLWHAGLEILQLSPEAFEKRQAVARQARTGIGNPREERREFARVGR